MTKKTPPLTVERPPIQLIGCEPSAADFFFWFRIAIVALVIISAIAYGVGK